MFLCITGTNLYCSNETSIQLQDLLRKLYPDYNINTSTNAIYLEILGLKTDPLDRYTIDVIEIVNEICLCNIQHCTLLIFW